METEKTANKPLVFGELVMFMGFLSLLLGTRLIPQMILLWVLGFLISNERYLWLDIIFKTFRRDFIAAYTFFRVKCKIWLWEKNEATVLKILHQLCQKNYQKIAFHCDHKSWTFQKVNEFSNQIGHYFISQGYKRGDVIGLCMENSIEFITVWLGLAKIGVVTALINTNLRGKLFLHSIKTAQWLGIIYSRELSDTVNEEISELQEQKLFLLNENDTADQQYLEKVIDLKPNILASSNNDLHKEIEEGKPTDKLLFIYTSGTTGMPKAAVINNNRYIFMSCNVKIMLDVKETDILYNPLPLYHPSGGIIADGQALLGGTTVVIRKKFSASNFWLDCIKYKCFVACYIGEICIYLLAVPESPLDTQHKVRLIFGNGLRPKIWTKFVNRFRLNQVGEFYGATEKNSNLVNIDNKVGAAGFVPRMAGLLYPVALVKVDQKTEEPIRNSKGFCIRCKPGEPGMFIGKIDPKRAINSFAGYADKEASKKILRNVFKEGVRYFNSGDILVMNNYGYFSFKERTGNTFRWRGENVSTSEVEAVISNIIGLKDAIVYGVEVPQVEGQVGMVAILDTDNALNLKEFNESLKRMLPTYARPLFVRIQPSTDRTKQFELLTTSLYNDIKDGIVNL